jgi:small subunit ribosomal protein S16
MLVIRLFRIGKKNQPSFKIVVTDKRNPSKGGRFVEELGFWNPLTKEKVLKKERIKYWLSVGAKPSSSIHNLLISEKIIEGKKIAKHKKPKEKEAAPEGGEPRPEFSGREKLAEKKPASEAKPETKTEEKPAEKIETPKEEKAPEETKPETKKE